MMMVATWRVNLAHEKGVLGSISTTPTSNNFQENLTFQNLFSVSTLRKSDLSFAELAT